MAEPFDTIDAKIEQYKPFVVAKQDEFFNANGRYWQLKRTHTVAPDGTPSTPDNLDNLPSDETEGWSAVVTLPGQLEMALETHKYNGPQGQGWLLIIYLTVDGAEWRRVIDFGPEGRDQAWAEVDDGLI